ncbi:MAG: hypothetical protein KKC19_02525 [Nanoarchaeota archaeon]|nr:hypothetical protein [Nanoarchaeota archaeon]
MEKYNLRNEKGEDEDFARSLQDSPSRMYDLKNVRENVDNCSCPSCPCADADLPKAIYVVGLGVLAGTVGVLAIATAAEVASKK